MVKNTKAPLQALFEFVKVKLTCFTDHTNIYYVHRRSMSDGEVLKRYRQLLVSHGIKWRSHKPIVMSATWRQSGGYLVSAASGAVVRTGLITVVSYSKVLALRNGNAKIMIKILRLWESGSVWYPIEVNQDFVGKSVLISSVHWSKFGSTTIDN